MSALIVDGGHPLEGAVDIQGAKNSVLPILAACVLAPGECAIRNCPNLSDVTASVKILRQLGCGVRQEGDALVVDARRIGSCAVPDHLMREMRSSVIFLGAILGRMGAAELSFPGGCELGPRPINLHLAALRALGAQVEEKGGRLTCRAPRLTGAEITLSLPSVGATENAMLAAVAAQGTTVINNAAREPEIADLQGFLRTLGARVRGAGSSVITIQGGIPLHGGAYTVMADRIVAATYLSAAAAAGGTVELRGIDYRHLSTVTAALTEAGCAVRSAPKTIAMSCQGCLKGVRPIRTAPYPGFPTDAQPPLMAALCRGTGTSVFVENIFESRYRHIDELVRMGADIRVEGRVAVVCGVPRLHGAQVHSADLRGGAALVVAALGADGESVITGLEHISRGYESMERDLSQLGAHIRRVEESRMPDRTLNNT